MQHFWFSFFKTKITALHPIFVPDIIYHINKRHIIWIQHFGHTFIVKIMELWCDCIQLDSRCLSIACCIFTNNWPFIAIMYCYYRTFTRKFTRVRHMLLLHRVEHVFISCSKIYAIYVQCTRFVWNNLLFCRFLYTNIFFYHFLCTWDEREKLRWNNEFTATVQIE